MPAEYYCPDNFFKKMTDLESPKKNNDCYFYYYSTCVKGDSCSFRHEPSALGCETVCNYWKEGKCMNVHCNFRHMELRKNRKAIPCYWETQPMGCLKAHCPFLHQLPRPSESSAKNTDMSDSSMDKTERKVTAVDSLVVNFEEESDSEFGPSAYSPLKTPTRTVKVKTLEEIKLEKIQAESAAFYSYNNNLIGHEPPENADIMRQRIVTRIACKQTAPERWVTSLPNVQRRLIPDIRCRKRLSNDELANILGDESLRKKSKIVFDSGDGNLQVMLNKDNQERKSSITHTGNKPKRKLSTTVIPEVEHIKVKTLAEIRAERNAKSDKLNQEIEEAEVSSTSKEEIPVKTEAMQVDEPEPQAISTGASTSPLVRRRIRLRRKLPVSENVMSSSTNSANVEISNSNSNDPSEDTRLKYEPQEEEKILDDVLLLEEDDDDYDITLKAEEDLLNDLDDED